MLMPMLLRPLSRSCSRGGGGRGCRGLPWTAVDLCDPHQRGLGVRVDPDVPSVLNDVLVRTRRVPGDTGHVGVSTLAICNGAFWRPWSRVSGGVHVCV